MARIQSTVIEIKPLEFIGEKVYIRTNIERIVKSEQEEYWEYNEIEVNATKYFEQIKSDIEYVAIMTGVDL